MRYIEFRDSIQRYLLAHPEGATWAELREALSLPYPRPCSEWTRRLEFDIDLIRRKRAGNSLIWKILPENASPFQEFEEECRRAKFILRLSPVFTPPGDDRDATKDDFFTFSEIIGLAEDTRLQKRKRDLRKRQKRLREFEKSLPKLKKALRDHKAGKIDDAHLLGMFSEIIPANESTSMADAKTTLTASSPRQVSTAREIPQEPPWTEEMLKHKSGWLKVHTFLSDQAIRGDAEAITFLLDIAETATLLLMGAEKLHPETVRNISMKKSFWPVLASSDHDWVDLASKRLSTLALGEQPSIFKSRLRSPRGADENNPARLWAKAAVRAIEQTIWRHLSFSIYSDEIMDLIEKGQIWWPDSPRWVGSIRGLGQFSKASLKSWSFTVRALIREEVPDFHLRPEWKNVRASLEARERATPGVIQNKILDNICSALEKIAPSG
jgi:hypothetical protein